MKREAARLVHQVVLTPGTILAGAMQVYLLAGLCNLVCLANYNIKKYHYITADQEMSSGGFPTNFSSALGCPDTTPPKTSK